MSSLKDTIEALASQFAMSIIGALRSASLAEVMEVTSGEGSTRASGPAAAAGGARASAAARSGRGPGRPKKKAAAAAAPAPAKRRATGRPGRLGRRSLADIGKVIDDVAALLQKHPAGLRAEEIRRELGVQAKELPRPLADGLAAGRFSKQGQKRATTYYPSGAKSAAPKTGKGLPKKRGK